MSEATKIIDSEFAKRAGLGATFISAVGVIVVGGLVLSGLQSREERVVAIEKTESAQAQALALLAQTQISQGTSLLDQSKHLDRINRNLEALRDRVLCLESHRICNPPLQPE